MVCRGGAFQELWRLLRTCLRPCRPLGTLTSIMDFAKTDSELGKLVQVPGGMMNWLRTTSDLSKGRNLFLESFANG